MDVAFIILQGIKFIVPGFYYLLSLCGQQTCFSPVRTTKRDDSIVTNVPLKKRLQRKNYMSTLFNKLINGRQFNFQPLEFGEQTGYHVDVKDDEGTRWEFRMSREEDGWKMETEKIPAWIIDAQTELGEAIDEHE